MAIPDCMIASLSQRNSAVSSLLLSFHCGVNFYGSRYGVILNSITAPMDSADSFRLGIRD